MEFRTNFPNSNEYRTRFHVVSNSQRQPWWLRVSPLYLFSMLWRLKGSAEPLHKALVDCYWRPLSCLPVPTSAFFSRPRSTILGVSEKEKERPGERKRGREGEAKTCLFPLSWSRNNFSKNIPDLRPPSPSWNNATHHRSVLAERWPGFQWSFVTILFKGVGNKAIRSNRWKCSWPREPWFVVHPTCITSSLRAPKHKFIEWKNGLLIDWASLRTWIESLFFTQTLIVEVVVVIMAMDLTCLISLAYWIEQRYRLCQGVKRTSFGWMIIRPRAHLPVLLTPFRRTWNWKFWNENQSRA